MIDSFIAAVKSPENISEPAYWFILRGFHLLVHNKEPELHIPITNDPLSIVRPIVRRQYLGFFETQTSPIHCYSAEVPEDCEVPEGMAFLSLRRLFGRLEDGMLALAGRAVQIVEWDRTHQFCGRCGIPVQNVPFERAKEMSSM